MNIVSKVSLCLLIIVVMAFGLSAWHPWQRQPDYFHYPLILPFEAVDGDTIVISKPVTHWIDDLAYFTFTNRYIHIDGNRTIKSITVTDDSVSINSTRHVTLFELLTMKEDGEQ